jgi:hypothetical protein
VYENEYAISLKIEIEIVEQDVHTVVTLTCVSQKGWLSSTKLSVETPASSNIWRTLLLFFSNGTISSLELMILYLFRGILCIGANYCFLFCPGRWSLSSAVSVLCDFYCRRDVRETNNNEDNYVCGSIFLTEDRPK